MSDVQVKSCEECGASVYPEHLGAHKAGYWGGKLVCVHCYARHQSQQVTIGPGEITTPQPHEEAAPELDEAFAGQTPEVHEPAAEPLSTAGEADPISLAEDDQVDTVELPRPTIKAFTGGGLGVRAETQHKYKRHLNHDGKGAIRCRIFHAKLNDGALKFMEDQINDWIDDNPEIEIKNFNTNVGVVEGKSSEPHLIVTLFY